MQSDPHSLYCSPLVTSYRYPLADAHVVGGGGSCRVLSLLQPGVGLEARGQWAEGGGPAQLPVHSCGILGGRAQPVQEVRGQMPLWRWHLCTSPTMPVASRGRRTLFRGHFPARTELPSSPCVASEPAASRLPFLPTAPQRLWLPALLPPEPTRELRERARLYSGA